MASSAGAAPFGAELRRRREGAGLSQAALAARVHYSKGHLSKIENGVKAPTSGFARQCDAVLGAAGALAALVVVATPAAEPTSSVTADDVWRSILWRDGGYEFGTDIGGGAGASLMSWAPPVTSGGDDRDTVRAWRLVYDELRRLGQTAGPSELVPVLVPATHVLRVTATRSRSATRRDLLVLASRFAEYTGWMAQEKGDERAALWWTDHAVELALAGGDDRLVAYAYVRRALVALHRTDPVGTVALARKAQREHGHARILGLAAQREAQGHACAGEYDACREALDRAAAHLSRAGDSDDGAPTLGTTAVADPVAMSTGWCLQELGRSGAAAEILSTQLALVAPRAERARARYGTRLALALASIHDLEQACAMMDPILETLPHIDSSTIRADLGALARTLHRWHGDPLVRAIMPRLNAALRTEIGLGHGRG